jgi:hypothetical protein
LRGNENIATRVTELFLINCVTIGVFPGQKTKENYSLRYLLNNYYKLSCGYNDKQIDTVSAILDF